MKNGQRIAICSFSLCLMVAILIGTPLGLAADTIYLRNGRAHYGKIVNQTATQVLLQTERGMRTVEKKQILRITYEAYEEAVRKEQAEAAAARRRALERARLKERLKREAEERRRREMEAARTARIAFRRQQALVRSERAAFLRKQVETGKIKRDDIHEPIEFWDFAWRSLAVPGWGHVYMDRPVIGYSYAAGFLVLLGRTYSTRRQALAAQAANDRETTNNSVLFGLNDTAPQVVRYFLAVDANRRYLTEYQTKIDRHNATLASVAILYGIQLLHIIADGFTWEEGGLLGALTPGPSGGRSPGPKFELALLPEETPDARGHLTSLGRAPNRPGASLVTRFSVTLLF